MKLTKDIIAKQKKVIQQGKDIIANRDEGAEGKVIHVHVTPDKISHPSASPMSSKVTTPQEHLRPFPIAPQSVGHGRTNINIYNQGAGITQCGRGRAYAGVTQCGRGRAYTRVNLATSLSEHV